MNTSACYHGQKWGKVYGPDGGELDPGPSLRVLIHSPSGFGWGEVRDGSAQLALALLLDVTGDPEVAVAFHEDFKASVIAELPWPKPWRLDVSGIRSWLSGARADLEVNILPGVDSDNDFEEHGEEMSRSDYPPDEWLLLGRGRDRLAQVGAADSPPGSTRRAGAD